MSARRDKRLRRDVDLTKGALRTLLAANFFGRMRWLLFGIQRRRR